MDNAISKEKRLKTEHMRETLDKYGYTNRIMDDGGNKSIRVNIKHYDIKQ